MEGMMIRLDLEGGILSRMVFGCNEVGVDNTEEYLACFENYMMLRCKFCFACPSKWPSGGPSHLMTTSLSAVYGRAISAISGRLPGLLCS